MLTSLGLHEDARSLLCRAYPLLPPPPPPPAPPQGEGLPGEEPVKLIGGEEGFEEIMVACKVWGIRVRVGMVACKVRGIRARVGVKAHGGLPAKKALQ